MSKLTGLLILAASFTIPEPATWFGVAATILFLGIVSITTEH